jgi:hypothetical protein
MKVTRTEIDEKDVLDALYWLITCNLDLLEQDWTPDELTKARYDDYRRLLRRHLATFCPEMPDFRQIKLVDFVLKIHWQGVTHRYFVGRTP